MLAGPLATADRLLWLEDHQASAAAAAGTLPAPGRLGCVGWLYTGGQNLPGGQWQKIALGRAIRPPAPLLVVLDEPTASLDAHAEHELFERYSAAARLLPPGAWPAFSSGLNRPAALNALRAARLVAHALSRAPVRRHFRYRACSRGADGCLGAPVPGSAVLGRPVLGDPVGPANLTPPRARP